MPEVPRLIAKISESKRTASVSAPDTNPKAVPKPINPLSQPARETYKKGSRGTYPSSNKGALTHVRTGTH
jgi:hypothetical protein